ncbi:hypothetical protein FKM82_013060 [Ascaphus truei]
MRSLLQVLCVLSTLAATGYSLSCTQCVALSGTSCTGPSITCPANKVCMAAYSVTTAGGVEISNVFGRNCELQNKCGLSGSVNVPNGKIKMGTSCCTTDNCTPSMPTLPADNDVKNGLTCRTCTSTNSAWCYTTDTMLCTGSENMCLLQSTKITGNHKRVLFTITAISLLIGSFHYSYIAQIFLHCTTITQCLTALSYTVISCTVCTYSISVLI